MKKLYYIYIFVLSFVPLNLNATLMFSIPPIQVNYADIFNVMIIGASVVALREWKTNFTTIEEKIYLVFLAWLLVGICIGIPRYSFRAIGETRTIVQFFAFFFPYAMLRKESGFDIDDLFELVTDTVILSALCGSIMFFIGPFFDVTITDYRGERILTSHQTFYLLLAFSFIGIRYILKKKLSPKHALYMLLFFTIAILSKNRTALVSVGALFLLFLFLNGYIRVIIFLFVISLVSGTLMAFAFPSTADDLQIAFNGIFDPADDPNATWRILIQGAALEQGLETFWTGQGYGGYFEFFVQGLNYNQANEVTPHNQFLTIFLKTGIIGVALCLLSLGAFAVRYISIRSALRLESDERYRATATILSFGVLSQFLYGFGYDFVPFYGLYFGFGTILFKSIASKNNSQPYVQE